MSRTAIILMLLLTAGFALAYVMRPDTSAIETAEPVPAAPEKARTSAPSRPNSNSSSTDARLFTLEQALREERTAREELREEVRKLAETVAGLNQSLASRGPGPFGMDPEQFQLPPGLQDRVANLGRIAVGFGEDMQKQRLDRLVEAGFDQQTAQRITQRESELLMEALQTQFDATRGGDAPPPLAARQNIQSQLRGELGDVDFERYLRANGQPTEVYVNSVLESSPAKNAGLQAGDRIVSYGGQRVFDLTELSDLTRQGVPGQSVVVDVMRDGYPIKVSLPRGPLGIQSSVRGRGGFQNRIQMRPGG